MGYSMKDMEEGAKSVEKLLEEKQKQNAEKIAKNIVHSSPSNIRGAWVILHWIGSCQMFVFLLMAFSSLLLPFFGESLAFLCMIISFFPAYKCTKNWFNSTHAQLYPVKSYFIYCFFIPTLLVILFGGFAELMS